MRRITIADYTLRALYESSENRDAHVQPLLFREKTALAGGLDELGADAIELAPINSVKEDTVIIKTIASLVQNSALAIPVGITGESLENAWNAIKEARRPILQIMVPVSTVQMEYSYHLKADKMVEKIAGLTQAAAAKGCPVELVARDASRADISEVLTAAKAAQEQGAFQVTYCDDAGLLMPDELAEKVRLLKQALSVPVCVQVSNAMGMASACAFYALQAGADGVKCTIGGEDTLQLTMLSRALKIREDDQDWTCGLKMTEVQTDVETMLKKIAHTELTSGGKITPSGSDGILLDQDADLESVSRACVQLGYDLSEEDTSRVLEEVLRVCEQKPSIGRQELEAVIASYAMQVPSSYHLENYTITNTLKNGSMTRIDLVCAQGHLSGLAAGDGPIDSSFKAIEQCIAHHYELDDFQIQAVTSGREALGSALVRLRSNGRLYSGTGLSTDIVGASIRAYINALNKIFYSEL